MGAKKNDSMSSTENDESQIAAKQDEDRAADVINEVTKNLSEMSRNIHNDGQLAALK